MTKSILVIDDESTIRNSFKLALEDLQYQIDTADCGANGIELFVNHSYDLVFLDLKMPEMDGTEVLEELRKHNKTIPIFIVTAFSDEFATQLQSLSNNDIKYQLLRKPIGVEQIQNIAKGVLEGPIIY